MKRTRRSLLATAVGLLGAGCSSYRQGSRTGTADTTTGHQPTTTATRTTTDTRPAISPRGALAWKQSFVSDVTFGPAFEDGTLYVGTSDGQLFAFATDGTERWTSDVGGSFFEGTGDDRSPIVADGTLFLTSGNRSGPHGDEFALYALDPATGEEQWSFSVESMQFLSLLGVVNGTAFAATSDDALSDHDERLFAIDAETGAEQWRVEVGDPRDVAVSADTIALAVWGALQAVDTSGTVRWTNDTFGDVAPNAPILADGRLFVATDDPDQSGLYALDPSTGDQQWARTERFVNSLRVGERAYVGGETVAAYAFDGTEQWDTGTEAFVRELHDETLYASPFSEDGNGVMFALAADDGSEKWAYEFDAETASVETDGNLTAASLQGSPIVDGLDPAMGKRQFRYRATDREGLSPPVVADGTAFLVDGATLYALG